MIISILKILARITVKKYKPTIVGVAGGVGKTSSKRAIFSVIKQYKRVRVSEEKGDREIAFLLTILGSYQKVRGGMFLWWVALGSLMRVIFRASYPEVLVLEYEGGREGNLKTMLSIARPDIAVITTIGDIPPEVEVYSSSQAAVREKAKVVEHLTSAGYAILNTDDDAVLNMRERTKGQVLTYGFSKEADVMISNLENRDEDKRPLGISFKINHEGNFVPVRMEGVFGKPHAYAAATAAAVSLILMINLVKISQALSFYEPPKGRLRLLKGIKDTFILDDTCEASPTSMKTALMTLGELPAKKKIAVLGDILGIGRYAVEAHEEMGRIAAKNAKVVITVGDRSKFIADMAEKSGISKRNIFSFDSIEEAGKKVQEVMKKGDLVLVKGAGEMKMEKIVEEIMFEPQKAKEVLVRRQ